MSSCFLSFLLYFILFCFREITYVWTRCMYILQFLMELNEWGTKFKMMISLAEKLSSSFLSIPWKSNGSHFVKSLHSVHSVPMAAVTLSHCAQLPTLPGLPEMPSAMSLCFALLAWHGQGHLTQADWAVQPWCGRLPSRACFSTLDHCVSKTGGKLVP